MNTNFILNYKYLRHTNFSQNNRKLLDEITNKI